MTSPLAIAHLTLLDVPPEALVRLAAETGFDAVTLQISPNALSWGPTYPVAPGSTALKALRATLSAAGVAVHDVQAIRLTEAFDALAYEPMLQAGAELGAGHAVVVCGDRNLDRATGNLASLAELARPLGLSIAVEYMAYAGLPNLKSALAMIERTGQDNVVPLIDTLHHHRCGDTAGDLARLPPAQAPYVQLCDAPLQRPGPAGDMEALRHEALTDRLLPGDGGLPLASMMAALPAGIPWVLEVPLQQRRTAYADDRAFLEDARRKIARLSRDAAAAR